jgi:protein ImuA
MMPMASAARPDFPSLPAPPAALLGRLRQQLCTVEASTALRGECPDAVGLGFAPVDDALDGGLACGALHEIAAPCETEIAAATGFAVALAARKAMLGEPKRNVVWIVEDLSQAESGAPYGPGIDEIGLAPERLITVTAARARDALWAMEEALRCRAVGVVIGELRTRDIDTVTTRRLSLAAAAGNALALLLRTTPADEPSAAATRWIVGAARGSLETPCLIAQLVRNRRGRLGTWIVEWNSAEQRFELATHSEPVAGTIVDRPYRSAVA